MKKQEYIKPEIEVVLFEAQSQMMTTSPGTEPGFGDIEADDSEVLTNKRRGRWGNLWAKD